MPLTDTVVRQAKPARRDYTLQDADGLALFVSAKGTKSWHFRFSWAGKQPRISLGTYPEFCLKTAREWRDPPSIAPTGRAISCRCSSSSESATFGTKKRPKRPRLSVMSMLPRSPKSTAFPFQRTVTGETSARPWQMLGQLYVTPCRKLSLPTPTCSEW
jgi:hypothetical protein